MDDKIRLNASEVKHFLENGEGLDDFFENVLAKAVEQLENEGGPTFVIGPVIVVNDLETEDEEESEDEEDPDDARDRKADDKRDFAEDDKFNKGD